jgi:hypothetical protein
MSAPRRDPPNWGRNWLLSDSGGDAIIAVNDDDDDGRLSRRLPQMERYPPFGGVSGRLAEANADEDSPYERPNGSEGEVNVGADEEADRPERLEWPWWPLSAKGLAPEEDVVR